jgi:hypothetical protein
MGRLGELVIVAPDLVEQGSADGSIAQAGGGEESDRLHALPMPIHATGRAASSNESNRDAASLPAAAAGLAVRELRAVLRGHERER